jgi:hypothetical protein
MCLQHYCYQTTPHTTHEQPTAGSSQNSAALVLHRQLPPGQVSARCADQAKQGCGTYNSKAWQRCMRLYLRPKPSWQCMAAGLL